MTRSPSRDYTQLSHQHKAQILNQASGTCLVSQAPESRCDWYAKAIASAQAGRVGTPAPGASPYLRIVRQRFTGGLPV